MKIYCVIEGGADKIFKGNAANERYQAGEFIELPEEKGAEFVAKGYVTSFVPPVIPAPEVSAPEAAASAKSKASNG